MSEENTSGSSGSTFPDLGDTWRYGCPRSPDWDSDVDSWTESEGTCSVEQYEHNVESLALEVIGQNWSGETVSLFLEDWGLAREALKLPSGSRPVASGNA